MNLDLTAACHAFLPRTQPGEQTASWVCTPPACLRSAQAAPEFLATTHATPALHPGPGCLQVSIVQPISGVGLVGLAVYSHLFLKEKLATLEWLAVALAFAGTLGLGATSSEGGGNNGTGDGSDAAAGAAGTAGGAGAAAAAAGEPGALRMLGVLSALALAVLLVSLLRSRHSHRQRRGGDKSAAASYGLQAGACFGLSAASCRIGE